MLFLWYQIVWSRKGCLPLRHCHVSRSRFTSTSPSFSSDAHLVHKEYCWLVVVVMISSPSSVDSQTHDLTPQSSFRKCFFCNWITVKSKNQEAEPNLAPNVAGKAATGRPRPWCHCLKLLPNRISGKKRPRLPWKTLPQMIPWANRPLASDMSPRLACTNKYLRKYKIPIQHTICHDK